MAKVGYTGTPRIIRREIDATTSPATPGVTTGACVIEASNGPVNRRVYITSRQQFQSIFGSPLKNPQARTQEQIVRLNMKNAGMYAADILLGEFEAMYFVRATDNKSFYANAYVTRGGNGASHSTINTIASREALNDRWYDGYTVTVNALGDPGIRDYEEGNYDNNAGLLFGAINPGTEGNRIGISVIKSPTVETITSTNADGTMKYIDATGKLLFNVQKGTTDINNRIPFVVGSNGFNWLWSYDDIALTNETDDGEWISPEGNIWSELFKVNVYQRSDSANANFFEPANQDLIALKANIGSEVSESNQLGITGTVDFLKDTANLIMDVFTTTTQTITVTSTSLTGTVTDKRGSLSDANTGSQYFTIVDTKKEIDKQFEYMINSDDYGTARIVGNVEVALSAAQQAITQYAELENTSGTSTLDITSAVSAPVVSVNKTPVLLSNKSFSITSTQDFSFNDYILEGWIDERTDVWLTSGYTPTSGRANYTITYKDSVLLSTLITNESSAGIWSYTATSTATADENIININFDWSGAKELTVAGTTYNTFSYNPINPIVMTNVPSSWYDNASSSYVGPSSDAWNLKVQSNDRAWTSAGIQAGTSTDSFTFNNYTIGTAKINTYSGYLVEGSTQELKQSYWDRIVPKEQFTVSTRNISDINGSSLFITDVINGFSNLIYVPLVTVPEMEQVINSNKIIGFQNGNQPGPDTFIEIQDKTGALNLLSSREKAEFDVLINTDIYQGELSDPGANAYMSYQRELGRVAATRMDSIASVQSTGIKDNTPEKQLRSATKLNNFKNPSYVAMYAGFDRVHDRINSINVVVPKSVAGAYLMARTDRVAHPWNAPAGTDRGIVDYSLGSFPVISSNDFGILYDNNINTTLLKNGYGNTMWGQKTAQLKKTALDRINVRRMLLYVENNIEKILEPFILNTENTPTTWNNISKLCTNFLDTVLNQGGVDSYQVICDESNNDIESNTLYVVIGLVPIRVVEYIEFTTMAINVGVRISGEGLVITES